MLREYKDDQDVDDHVDYINKIQLDNRKKYTEVVKQLIYLLD